MEESDIGGAWILDATEVDSCAIPEPPPPTPPPAEPLSVPVVAGAGIIALIVGFLAGRATRRK